MAAPAFTSFFSSVSQQLSDPLVCESSIYLGAFCSRRMAPLPNPSTSRDRADATSIEVSGHPGCKARNYLACECSNYMVLLPRVCSVCLYCFGLRKWFMSIAAPLILRPDDEPKLTALPRATTVQAGVAQRARVVLRAVAGPDFSFRGMEGVTGSQMSGAGHLLSFTGTDSLPALDWIEDNYPGADSGPLGGSVAATEHSVMRAGGDLDEKQTFARLLNLYPTGIVSVVYDTWDLS